MTDEIHTTPSRRKRKSRRFKKGEIVGGLELISVPSSEGEPMAILRDQVYGVRCLNCGHEYQVGRVTIVARARVPTQHCYKCRPHDFTTQRQTREPRPMRVIETVDGHVWPLLTAWGPLGSRFDTHLIARQE
jgi:hypothetical protein